MTSPAAHVRAERQPVRRGHRPVASPFPPRFHPGFVGLVVGLLWIACGASADDPQTTPREPLRYRYIFLPQDAIDAEDGSYFPVPRGEFDALLSAIRGKHSAPEAAQGPRIEEAHYSARLVGERLVNGRAEWRILHDAEEPAMASLDPLSLAIEQVFWESAEAAEAADPPAAAAIVGMDESGRTVALVPSSGRLVAEWSLAGKRGSRSEWIFPLRLPPCSVNRLELTLPSGLLPSVSGALVSPLASSPAEDGHAAWLIRMRGTFDGQLVIQAEGPQPAARWLLHEQTHYQIGEEGLNARHRYLLDIYGPPLQQLTLQLDAAATMVSATVDDLPVTWTEAEDAGCRTVALDLQEPLAGAGRIVEIQTLGELEVGRRWRLPAAAVAGAQWVEGEVDLEVIAPLELVELDLRGARQTAVLPAREPAVGESVRISRLAADDPITAVLRRATAPIAIDAATTVSISAAMIRARQVLDVTCEGQGPFQLRLGVSPEWMIDLVETDAADRLEDWRLVSSPDGGRIIELRLREAIAADRPLRATLHGHRLGTRGRNRLAGRDIRPLALPRSQTSRQLVALTADGPSRGELLGDPQTVRLNPLELSAADRERLSAAPGSVIYLDDPACDELPIVLRSDPPEYRAEIQGQLACGPREAEHAWRIRCTPVSSTIRRIQVHFPAQPSAEPQWSVRGEPELSLRSQQPIDGAATAAGGRTWEIELSSATDQPFDVIAEWTEEPWNETKVSLVSLPDATSQTGEVVVLCRDNLPIRTAWHNLKPIFPDAPRPAEYSPVRAAYRYEPQQECLLVVSRAEPASPPMADVSAAPAGQGVAGREDLATFASAWVWSLRMDSRFFRDGQGLHEAQFLLESQGLGQAELVPPAGAEVTALFLDGELLAKLPETGPQRLSVRLPPGGRFPSITMRYTTRGIQLGAWGEVAAPWPQIALPVFQRSWQIMLPPGFIPAAAEHARDRGDGWLQRLGGPLLPPPGARFHPFDPDSWRRVLPAGSPAAGGEGSRVPEAEAILRELGRQYRAACSRAAGAAELTWADLLRAASGAQQPPSPLAAGKLKVDAMALAAFRLAPDSLVESVAPTSVSPDGQGRGLDDRTLGQRLLTAAQLELVADPRGAWIVTTLRDAATTRLRSSLRSEAVAAASLPDPPGVFDVERWAFEPQLAADCWRFPRVSAEAAIADTGWGRHHVADRLLQSAEKAGTTTLRVAHRDVVTGLAWAVFLVACGATAWAVSRAVLAAPLLIALAGTIALFVPAEGIALGSAAFLGTVAAAGVVWLCSAGERSRPLRERPSGAPRASALLRVGAGVLAALLLAPGDRGWAQRPAAATADAPESALPTAPRGRVYRVLSPIDDRQQPTGDYVWLREEFYQSLLKEASAENQAENSWLIRSADYSLEFEWLVAEERHDAKELRARYQLEVLRPDARITLPLDSNRVFLVPSSARLNGVPAPVFWEPDGGGLSIQASRTGEATLELTLRPQTFVRDGQVVLDIPILRVPQSRLWTRLPPGAGRVTCATAMGGAPGSERTGEQLLLLGPAERMTIEWPAGSTNAAAASETELDQLMWLDVRPGAVGLTCRFRAVSAGLPLRYVDLRVDPQLVWLPARSDDRGYEIAAGESPAAVSRVEFTPPLDQGQEFTLRFLLPQASGAGRIEVPFVEAVAASSNRRLLAVSVAPSLRLVLPEAAASENLADFAAAWGNLPAPPDYVIAASGDGLPWVLEARPADSPRGADQRTRAAVSSERIDVEWEADIDAGESPCVQHVVVLPADAEGLALSVAEGDGERPHRWWLDPAGRLVIRNLEPTTAAQRIRLRLSLPARRVDAAALQPPRLEAVQLRSHVIELFRRSSILAEVGESPGFQPVPAATVGRYQPGWGRLLAVLEADPAAEADPQILLRLTPNRPRTRGRLVIQMARDESAWRAEAHCTLNVSSGLLDVVRLEAPAAWTGPFVIAGDVDLEEAPVPGQPRRYLVVRPHQAAARSLDFRLKGTVAVAPGRAVSAPDIALREAERIDRYLIAPTAIGARRIAWEIAGLQAGDYPSGLTPEDPSTVCYRALGPRFQATIRDVEDPLGTPQVLAADLQIGSIRDGSCLGEAVYSVLPAGLDRCQLQAPQGCRIMHLSVGGIPALLEPQGDGLWSFPLGPRQLAQWVRVIFLADTARDDSGLSTAAVPQIVGVAVAASRWTVYGQANGADVPSQPGARPLSAQDRFLFGLRDTLDLMEQDAEVLAGSDPLDAQRWYAVWLPRYGRQRSQRLAWNDEAGGEHPSLSADVAALDARRREIADWLGLEQDQDPASLQVGVGPMMLSQIGAVESDAIVHGEQTGALASLVLGSPRTRPGDEGRSSRLTTLFVLVALTWIAMLWTPRPCGRPWRQLAGAAISVAVASLWLLSSS